MGAKGIKRMTREFSFVMSVTPPWGPHFLAQDHGSFDIILSFLWLALEEVPLFGTARGGNLSRTRFGPSPGWWIKQKFHPRRYQVALICPDRSQRTEEKQRRRAEVSTQKRSEEWGWGGRAEDTDSRAPSKPTVGTQVISRFPLLLFYLWARSSMCDSSNLGLLLVQYSSQDISWSLKRVCIPCNIRFWR